MRPASAPVLILVAGPNGAGKSTIAKAHGIPVVDPDVEAAREKSEIAGGRAAILRIRRAIESGESFALETTLSGRHGLSVMRLAKASGYSVLLLYVGIATPQDAIQRIRRRVGMGGHGVPSVDVRRRYWRSLNNLNSAIQAANEALVFDNSYEGRTRFVAAFKHGMLAERAETVAGWAVQALSL